MTPEEFFDGSPLGLAVFRRVRDVAARAAPDVVVRVSRSQVAFRRRRGMAYLWRPGQYLRNPSAEVVLSVALPAPVPSPRFKEVAHPARGVWMHHLEIRAVDEVDDEVARWLAEAAADAGRRRWGAAGRVSPA